MPFTPQDNPYVNVRVREEDVKLLSEAYRFAQFRDTDLPLTVKQALYRLLDAVDNSAKSTL